MTRRYLWWPKLDKEIEETVQLCSAYQESAKAGDTISKLVNIFNDINNDGNVLHYNKATEDQIIEAILRFDSIKATYDNRDSVEPCHPYYILIDFSKLFHKLINIMLIYALL